MSPAADIIVLDDEIARGSTVIELLERLRERDARSARIACTHGLFSAGALDRLNQQHDVLEIVSTTPSRSRPKNAYLSSRYYRLRRRSPKRCAASITANPSARCFTRLMAAGPPSTAVSQGLPCGLGAEEDCLVTAASILWAVAHRRREAPAWRIIVGTGDFKYRIIEDWAKPPNGWSFKEVGAVGVDNKDNVYVFNRGDHPVMVFDREGNFLRSWGEGQYPLGRTASIWGRTIRSI